MICNNKQNSFLYLDNSLSPKKKKYITDHLEKCSICKEKYKEDEAFLNSLRNNIPKDVPENLHKTIMLELNGLNTYDKERKKEIKGMLKTASKRFLAIVTALVICLVTVIAISKKLDGNSTLSKMLESLSNISSMIYTVGSNKTSNVKSSNTTNNDTQELEVGEVISKVEIYSKTLEFNKKIEEVNNIIEHNDGVIYSKTITTYDSFHKNAKYLIKLQEKDLNDFWLDVDKTLNVDTYSENKQKEVNIASLNDELSKLKAKKIEKQDELLDISDNQKIQEYTNTIKSIDYEIESLEDQIKEHVNQKQYSLVQLEINEVDTIKSKDVLSFNEFKQKIKNGFKSGLMHFIRVLEDIVAFIISNILFIVSYLAIFIFIYNIIKSILFKNKD